jgi:hypothetical protein
MTQAHHSAHASHSGDILHAHIAHQGSDVHLALSGGFYGVQYTEPPSHLAAEYAELRAQLVLAESAGDARDWNLIMALRWQLERIPQQDLARLKIINTWALEGSEAVLTHALKGATYTATGFLGLIDSVGYGFAGANGTGFTRGSLAGSITAVGGASPANGWNEMPSSVLATRGTPSFGTASSSGVNSDLAASAVALSILAARTCKGLFIGMRNKAGTASVATVGSTAGAILSGGLFAEGDQVFTGAGTLNATYTARITTV